MSNSSSINAEWQTITAAKRIGISVDEYLSHRVSGEKWCTACKAWHLEQEFGKDLTRGDGLSASCLSSRHVRKRTKRTRFHSHGWLKPVRNGDKKQARRRINYLVEKGVIPHPNELPCTDCGDDFDDNKRRHEYDHARGYDGENQLYVEPVCSSCHHKREVARRG